MHIAPHQVNDGVVRLAVTGEIDLATAEDLYEAIMAAVIEGHAAVVVDLAGVALCDSVGIGALVRARNAAVQQGTTVQVINPHGVVHRALEITGVLDALSGEA